jgi:hypothetical protein
VLNTAAYAASFTLTDGNSSVQLDPASSAGMTNWTVDGTSLLTQQWFWYRVGPAGGELPINTLSGPVVSQPDAASLITTYTKPGQFSVQAVYSLVGGATLSGTSDLAEQIKIQNLTGAPLDMHFFQYAFFTDAGSIQLGKNVQGLYNEALVSGGPIQITENVDSAISPGANHGETEPFNVTLTKLNDLLPTQLADVNFQPQGTNTWAFEWDRVINANGTLIISKDLNVEGVVPAPEPPAWSLVSVGLLAFGMARRYLGRRK